MLRITIAAATLSLTLTACDSGKNEIKGGTDTEDAGEGTTEATSEGEDEGATEAGTAGETAAETEADTEIGMENEEAGDEATSTPLVLAFHNEAVRFDARAGSFALTGAAPVASDWPAATTPWLALDRDGNGKIDGGAELFGSATVLRSGDTASNGFVALRELDSYLAGKLDAGVAAWLRLLVWSDVDGDRAATPAELSPVQDRGLVALELDYAVDRRCDARGNCEVERAGFTYRAPAGRELRGATIDVHLRLR